jgi:hypothetical protein
VNATKTINIGNSNDLSFIKNWSIHKIPVEMIINNKPTTKTIFGPNLFTKNGAPKHEIMIQITCGINKFPNCDDESQKNKESVKAVPKAGNMTKLTPVKKANKKMITIWAILEFMMLKHEF